MRLALSIAATITTVVFVAGVVSLVAVYRDPPPREVAYATPLVACVAVSVFGVASTVVG